MTEKLVGKWVLKESVNFDNYLKQVGIGMVLRQLVKVIYPTLEISVDENHWKMTTSTTFKTEIVEFDLGVEHEEDFPDGRKFKTISQFENGRFVETKKDVNPKGKTIQVETYVEENKLIIELNCEGVVCKRIFERTT
uniref:Cytosolic fatty-acid binding proteins domain-containing protein n=1 Tax=Acrobeloides nanus TaxID=290746 RepID=A0A914C2D1_9BILA